MRGKERCKVADAPKVRITPAYAGKRYLMANEFMRRAGSPPPMRGKGAVPKISDTANRITPAYAGKRLQHSVWFSFPEDHPRLCGEKPRSAAVHGVMQGSPPPMRGKAQARPFPHRQEGITPAYAGKRLLYLRLQHGIWDHPRLCGEKC